MYQVTINGQTFDRIPSSIQDVSISRFIKFRHLDLKNDYAILCWALDSQPEFKHTDDIEDQIAKLFALIQPVIDEIYTALNDVKLKTTLPDSIDVLGYEVKLKQGLLNDLPYWPYVVTKAIIKQEAKKKEFDPTDRLPEVLAHYLYSEVTKSKYDEAKAGAFVEVINDLPMIQCIQLGNFFLLKHQDLFPLNKKSLTQRLKKIIKKPE